MDRTRATRLIDDTFSNAFDEIRFRNFAINLLNNIDENKAFPPVQGQYIKDAFKNHIRQYKRIGTYTDPYGLRIDVMIVYLHRESAVDHARTMQRNFMVDYLKNRDQKDAALVAYVGENASDWRFSLVRMDYKTIQTESGKVKVKEDFTPARRYSFLVGQHEPNHTAQVQLLPIIEDTRNDPTLENIETAFNIESVTYEFFEKYKELFLQLKEELDYIVSTEKQVKEEFTKCEISTSAFAKKLLGQVVFLYFLQKKGWLGVEVGKDWGTGSKNFLSDLFNQKNLFANYYREILEPLFYEALAVARDGNYYKFLDCKIPFLNGGLFEPLGGYDWQKSSIKINNNIFINIFNTFNLYNFTVQEDEPLEREVAVDPEMLGKVFENLLEIEDRKSKGAFYTPREIVHYMCQESLINYLDTALNQHPHKIIQREHIELFIYHGELAADFDAAKENGTISYDWKLPESIRMYASEIDYALENIKICDPAIGSGAFPVGMMGEIIKARGVLSKYLPIDKLRTEYSLKRHAIENSIYGVDIDSSAVDIARLRLWLSLVVDEEDFEMIKPLPNLDYLIVCGNSLQKVKRDLLNEEDFKQLEYKKEKYKILTDGSIKHILKKEIDILIDRLTLGTKKFAFQIFFSEVFSGKGGFDVVIGNPPYVSTKGSNDDTKKELENDYDFVDDFYNHFYFQAFTIARNKGCVAYISSKTFFTIQSKENLRNLLESKRILTIIDTGSPFDAMVDTAVVICFNEDSKEDYLMSFLDARIDFEKPEIYQANISLYRTASRKVIFKPNTFNVFAKEQLNESVKSLIKKWWPSIETSKVINHNKYLLEMHRNQLKPGDITLLGLLTDGGVGLQTGNNGRFIGVREGTKQVESIKESRPKKLVEAINNSNIQPLLKIKTVSDAEKFLSCIDESHIVETFDSLKEKYGRDIFGQGYIYRIISDDMIANVNKLTPDERINGILNKEPHYVPYDKGDKDGNRWYLETPFVVDWSKESVKILQTDSKARWQGYQYFFRNGFCWSDIHTILIKSRLKNNGVYDVKSMSMFSLMENLPDWFFVMILNSTFISEYDFAFVNNTQTFQMNDARQIPVVIPTKDQLIDMELVFNQAISIQHLLFAGKINKDEAISQLAIIQQKVDSLVLKLYRLDGINN